MILRFSPIVHLTATFAFAAGTMLLAQTALAEQEKRVQGYVGEQYQSSAPLTALIAEKKSKKSIRKDRCDDTPRPHDCDVKY